MPEANKTIFLLVISLAIFSGKYAALSAGDHDSTQAIIKSELSKTHKTRIVGFSLRLLHPGDPIGGGGWRHRYILYR